MSLEWLNVNAVVPQILVNGDEPYNGNGYNVSEPFGLLLALDGHGVVIEGTTQELLDLLVDLGKALFRRASTDMSAPSENLDPEHET